MTDLVARPQSTGIALTELYAPLATIIADLRRTQERMEKLVIEGAQNLDLDATDHRTAAAVTKFLKWLVDNREVLKGDGLQLPKDELTSIAGTGKHSLDKARRSCLTRHRGNRRAGEIDKYTWNDDGVRSLLLYQARFLAAKQTHLAGEAEIAARTFERQVLLDEAMNPGQYEQVTHIASNTALGAK